MGRFQQDVESILEDLLGILERRHCEDLVSFVVFGSVGRGEARPGSDVDVLLVFRALPDRRHERLRLLADAIDELRIARGRLEADGHLFDWSPIILTAEEATYRSPVYLDMTEDARLPLDREGFFADVLDGMRARLRELGSRRVHMPDGSWYWDLKPGWKPGDEVEI
jgi:predicted nucleotidyltransferase